MGGGVLSPVPRFSNVPSRFLTLRDCYTNPPPFPADPFGDIPTVHIQAPRGSDAHLLPIPVVPTVTESPLSSPGGSPRGGGRGMGRLDVPGKTRLPTHDPTRP